MGKIAKQIDPEAELDLPDMPRSMHCSRFTERFEHQNNVWTIAMIRKLGMVLPRLRRPRR